MKSLRQICHIASFLKLHGHTFISISVVFKSLIISLILSKNIAWQSQKCLSLLQYS